MTEKVLYLGMPGSGKTTLLLNLMSEQLKTVSPNKIAFVSFTKKAITEAQDRALQQKNLHKKDMPYFKTLHALAFAAMGITKHDVIGDNHLAELSQTVGVDLLDESNTFRPLALYQLSRAKEWSLFDTWQRTKLLHLKPYSDIHYIVEAYQKYKEKKGLFDFTDMVLHYNKYGREIPVSTVFVDEAQDLTALQWTMIRKAFAGVERFILAGDDDQCIYSWLGADRKQFLNFEGRKETLNISYRCPQHIANLGNQISNQIKERYAKNLLGTDEEGSIKFNCHLDELLPKLKLNDQYLFLVRNRSDINWARSRLIFNKVSFAIDNKPYCPLKHYRALIGFQNSLENKPIFGSIAQDMSDCANQTKSFDPDAAYSFQDIFPGREKINDFRLIFSGISYRRLAYYHDILESHQDLLHPQINVSTIHGSKGAECENVILSCDQSVMTYKSAQLFADNEHRVFYVGVTRAKKNLFLLAHNKKRHYKMPLNLGE